VMRLYSLVSHSIWANPGADPHDEGELHERRRGYCHHPSAVLRAREHDARVQLQRRPPRMSRWPKACGLVHWLRFILQVWGGHIVSIFVFAMF
jgi:hypothetical protein